MSNSVPALRFVLSPNFTQPSQCYPDNALQDERICDDEAANWESEACDVGYNSRPYNTGNKRSRRRPDRHPGGSEASLRAANLSAAELAGRADSRPGSSACPASAAAEPRTKPHPQAFVGALLVATTGSSLLLAIARRARFSPAGATKATTNWIAGRRWRLRAIAGSAR